MELLNPGTGLIFWQLFVFLLLVILLGKMAWKPILKGLKEREASIQQALDSAEKARLELSNLKSDSEKLLKEAREARDKILRDARDASGRIQDAASVEAKKAADRLIEDAKAVINIEKQAALRDVKAQVVMFSLEIAEKLLKKNLSGDKAQKDLVTEYLKDMKMN